MKRAMGIILTGGKNNRLKELSVERSIAAIPLAENIGPSISPCPTW